MKAYTFGQYSHKNGYKLNEQRFNTDQPVFPEALREHGYQTAWIALDRDRLAIVQEIPVGIRADTGRIGNLQKIAVVPDPARDGIDGMSQQTGIHVVEHDIVVRQCEMNEGGEGDATFQHTAHHAGDMVSGANGVDGSRLEDTT